MKGKVVVLFTNEPPSDDPKFFGGKALTYYGRWTYKFEEAARRGAKACFIIHTNETAGYPYSVVRPLDGAQLKREPGKPALAFAGWLSRKAGDKLLGLAGQTVEEALKEADTKGFKAYSLGVNLKGHIPTRVEKIVSNNVVGMVEGSDPTLKVGGRRLHRPLGPPRRRPGRRRRRDLQRRGRQRHRLRPAARTGPRVGGPVAEAEAVGRSSWPSPRRRRGCSARSTTRSTRSSRWARRRSTSTST